MKKLSTTAIMITLLILSIFAIIIKPTNATIRRVPEDYPTIQAAINAANPGDTVLVAPGTYPECIKVNKSITLLGTNRQSIITGATTPLTLIDVDASNVRISNFTLIAPKNYYKGIYVEPPIGTQYTNVNITDNTIVGCNDGIFISRSSPCLVANNTLQGNMYGILLYMADYNTLIDNFINGTTYHGMYIYGRSRYTNITGNIITYGKYGVYLEYANYTSMYLNSIKFNTDYGLRLSYTFHSLIVGNTIERNLYGVYIWNCSQNQFYYNNFIENTNQVTHYATLITSNIWDTNKCPGARGNYWSDYTGVDDGSGIGRWGELRFKGDGVGDTLIPHLEVDWYPLMYPWTPQPQINPVAIFTWSPLEPTPNMPVIFNASKSYSPQINGTIILYYWNFGDHNLTWTTNPVIIHKYANTGNYTVTLKVTDNYGLTNQTSRTVRVREFVLEIDVYTQQPEPYSGKGPHMPSDAFAPQSLVILYAQVKYNYEPVENKEVAFTVTDPNGVEIISGRTNNTNSSGITWIDFRLASNATFGEYHVFASVEVSQRIANDTLTFMVGWIIEVVNVTTTDQYGIPKDTFIRGTQVYFSVNLKNIAFTVRNATLTVSLYDPTSQIIGATYIKLGVPPGLHEYNLAFDIKIPSWSSVGIASAHVCAFTTWPWSGGVPYCPEVVTEFRISAS